MGLATIFSIAAVLTGQKEAAKAGEIGYPTETLIFIERHETLGKIVVWGAILFFVSWVYLFLKYCLYISEVNRCISKRFNIKNF